jgi:DNA repair exonuclease SbcCD nuclease subunit
VEGVFIGDPHLDKLNSVLGDNANAMQVAEMEKAAMYAKSAGVPFVLIPGDIAEKPTLTDDAMVQLVSLFFRYPDLTWLILMGNHDFKETGEHSLVLLELLAQFKMLRNVVFYTKPVLSQKIDGVRFNFLPHPYQGKPPQSTRPHVNIGHFEFSGFKRDNGCVALEGHDLNEEANDFWLMGHLHTRQKSKRACYPGTLYQTSFGESLPKYMLHFRFWYKDGRLRKEFDWIKTDPAFKLYNVHVESKADYKNIKDDPSHYYKLFLKDGVILPDNFLTDHPNVIKTQGYKTKKELSILENEQIVALGDDELESFSPLEGAIPFLKAAASDKVLAQRAIKLLKRAIKNGFQQQR